MQYPEIIFRSDFAAGIKMTIGQAKKHKSLQSGRAYPDLFIAYPNKGFHGLFLELKREETRIYKKDNTYATPHLAEQAEVLWELNRLGYAANFALGFEQAKKIIDWYLKKE